MAGILSKALKYSLVGGVAAFGASEVVSASSAKVIPASNPWPHGPMGMAGMDNSAVRRGFQVYMQVCRSCHSMNFFRFRHLANVSHSEKELKEIAAEFSIKCEEPNEDGGFDERPRGLADGFPAPYENSVLARIANNGAEPPDLDLIVYAKSEELGFEKGEDYIFSLLNGFMEPPAGVTLAEGMHYNPYFGGNAIGMAPPLYNEIIQYEDGTPATTSQLSADVIQFLAWSCDKHRDERKGLSLKGAAIIVTAISCFVIMKKADFAGLKTTMLRFKNLKGKPHQGYQGKPKYY